MGQIKITTTIEGIEEFVIDDSTVAGIEFGMKLKESVVGLGVSEAENVVNNLNEVDAVEIKMWPVWLKKLPHVPESIEIKLMES